MRQSRAPSRLLPSGREPRGKSVQRTPRAGKRSKLSWIMLGLDSLASVAVLAGMVAAKGGPRPHSAKRPTVNSPEEIPSRGWREIAGRVWTDFNKDNITIIGAGVSFNIILSIFPAMAAFVAVYGLVADVDSVRQQIAALSILLPSDMLRVIGDEMMRLAKARAGGLSLTLVLGVAVSLWSANGAMRAMMVGLNVAYETTEKRGLIKQILVSMALTVGLLIFVSAAALALGAETVVRTFLGATAGWALDLARWPLLFLGCIGSLCLLYRHGPCRSFERWRWITWGSASATLLWLVTSIAFSFYISHFAHLGRTYGSLATAIGLMVWLWLSAVIVLAGAELNAAIEHQSAGGSPSEPKGDAGRRSAFRSTSDPRPSA